VLRSPPGSAEPPAPCARCERRIPGTRWGDLCAECLAELRKRATPLARRISLLAALLVVAYARFGLTLTPTGYFWIGAIAIGTYFLVRKIAVQVSVELMKK
jgi:hypothetical protein